MSDPVVTLGALRLAGVDNFGVRWVVPKGGLKGWRSSPSPVMESQKRPGQNGVWCGDSWLPGRTVEISGVLQASSPADAEEAIDRLIHACSLTDTTLVVEGAARTLSAMVRRSDEVLVEELNRMDHRWSLQVLAADPRKLGPEMTATTGLPSSSGGLTVPLVVPFSIDSTVSSGLVSLVNPGTIDGPVTLRIDGPVSAPRVTHVNSGRSLVFASSLALSAGEWITVDMQRREVLAQGQASRMQWVTSREWSTLQPGVNVWAFSSDGSMPGGMLTVSARPAWM